MSKKLFKATVIKNEDGTSIVKFAPTTENVSGEITATFTKEQNEAGENTYEDGKDYTLILIQAGNEAAPEQEQVPSENPEAAATN